MDRNSLILRFVDKEMLGVEIGPWHSPIAPKALGYDCLSLDVFDTETLRKRAAADPNVSVELAQRIEEVDLIGPATSLFSLLDDRGLAGKIDYVISSHNIEHIPNPIQFFQSCGDVLRKGGTLSMAIPDRRACFDFFRPFSSLAAWLEAYFENRTRPTNAQIFEISGLGANFRRGKDISAGFDLKEESPVNLEPWNRLRSSYDDWVHKLNSKTDEYIDTHCWVFTSSSFELLMRDAFFLGISPLEVIDISETASHEFYAHFRNVGYSRIDSDDLATDYYSRRNGILHRVVNEAGNNSIESLALRSAMMCSPNPPEQFDILSYRLKIVDGKCADISRANIQLEMENEELRVRSECLQVRVNGLEQSTSWRLTAPFRKIGAMFR